MPPRPRSKKKFDPAQQLPLRLQERIDQWQTAPPDHQHQAYGPLCAYLQGHKFPTDQFLVKPQALLREEAADNAQIGPGESLYIMSHCESTTVTSHTLLSPQLVATSLSLAAQAKT